MFTSHQYYEYKPNDLIQIKNLVLKFFSTVKKKFYYLLNKLTSIFEVFEMQDEALLKINTIKSLLVTRGSLRSYPLLH